MKQLFTGAALAALAGLVAVPSVQASRIDFAGPLVSVEEDLGNARYSGREVGDMFFGHIDDTTFAGEISDGMVKTIFDCCEAAGGFDLSNDVVVKADEAALFNKVLGTNTFSAGDIIDLVDIEGDTFIGNDNRIEVGLSYVLPQNTFASDNPASNSFDSKSALLTLYFVVEDPFNDGPIAYSAIGQVTAVPWPASVWLMGLGLPIVAGFARRQQNRC